VWASGQSDWRVLDNQGRRKYLSVTERVRFLCAADQQNEATRALCYLLAFTGCRVSEALELGLTQLDREQCTVTIRTLKRRRVLFRIVPLPESVVELLVELGDVDGRFWWIHRATAWRRVKRVMRLAGVEGAMATTKGLRHAFCMMAAGRNIPPNLIQRWAGHASPATTAIYLDAVGLEERQFASRMWDAIDGNRSPP